MLTNNKIVAYSLLAHVNNHEKGINDFSQIFIPLIKRSLAIMSHDNINRGLISDIKSTIDNHYNLDIPFPVLKELLNNIEKESNLDGREYIKIHDDNSFQLSEFSFLEFDEIVDKRKTEITNLEKLYEAFLIKENVSGEPSLFEFVDSKRLELSRFFTRSTVPDDCTDYINQAKFINELKNDSVNFNILRSIYLGSVISSYLDLEYDLIPDSEEIELLLDTSFITSLHGLSSIESKHTCEKLIELGNKLGYTFSILSITVQEIENLLLRVSNGLDKSFFSIALDPECIESACERRDLTKTDLERFSSHIKDFLKKHRINIINIDDSFIKEAEASSIYQGTIRRKHNPYGAPNDGVAYYYVYKKRGGEVRQFKNARSWFVGDSKHEKNYNSIEGNSIRERIGADYLVSYMWLSNPKMLTSEVIDIGLTKLVASCLDSALPNPELLYELDNNIRKYASEDLSDNDLKAVANSSAMKTIKNIKKLNTAASESEEKFNETLNEFIKIAYEEIDELKQNKNQEIDELKTTIKNNELKTEKILDSKRKEKIRLSKNELARLEETILRLAKIKNKLESKAEFSVNFRLTLIAISCLLLPHIICYMLSLRFGWGKMEGIIDFLQWFPTACVVIYFIKNKQVFHPKESYLASINKSLKKLYLKFNFDETFYNKILEDKKDISDEIVRLESKSSV